MKLRKVNPNLIKWPEVRVTARMDEETTAEFAESIKTIGIDEPIKVFQVGEELIGSDGRHRCFEAIRQGINPVEVYVREGTMEDVLCNNLMSGHLRGAHPISEMRHCIEVLNKEYGYDSEMIAAKTGLTRDRVEDIMEINQLTPYALEALDDGRLKFGHARALVKVKDPVTQDVIVADAITFNRSVAYVQDVVKMALTSASPEVQAPTPPAPQAPGTVKCGVCASDYLPGDLRMIAICPMCFSSVFQLLAELRLREQQDKKPEQVPNQVP